MSDILLQRLANGEINFEHFKKWILTQDIETDFKCSQNDFLTYFLNFIHEEINSQKKFGEYSLKCTPRKIKPSTSNIKLEHKNSSSLNKSFYSPPVKLPERSLSEADTSTPKMSKIQLEFELNNTYHSPVSPLYKEQNFITPKSKNHAICLGDFLVKKSSVKKKKSGDDSSKRITPTTLNHVKINNSFKSANSFTDFNTKEIVVNNLDQNRMFLAEERLKILSRKDSDDGSLLLNSKKLSISENKEEIEPQLSLVTYRNQINILADIYILILRNNLVLNITGEIYFLIFLLLIKQYSIDSTDDSQMGVDFLSDDDRNNLCISCNVIGCSDYFESVHNVIYFAVKCLESQFDVLKHYDKSTLKLFSLNKRIEEFSPKLSEKLKKLSEKKLDRIIESFEGNSNVCYNLDTDTKSNFASEVSFLSFKKQRDLFYEILRIWEKNRLLPGWCFQIGLSGKIKTLLSLQSESVNFMHFARLFKSQLLSSCGKSFLEDENDSLPSSFPNIDPSKLNRLKNRLVTKQSSNGLNALPHFVGHQEFYKDFIIVASNHSFNVHLCDTLIYEIMELNGNTFNISGFGESDANVDASMRKSFALTLRHLRVLAKFLGFIESVPYKSDTNNYHENMFSHHVKIREKKTPSLDIKQILMTSIKCNNITLTIPWIVKYLSMLDYVTLRLPYYLSVYEVLFQIYHSYEKPTKTFDYNSSLVKFSLGWLFDLPHFPDSEYTKFCSNKIIQFIRKPHTLDGLPIVDQYILYLCCPYLEEIKNMLTSSSDYRSVTVKHITPVTAVESSEQISKKRLEQQLEESFFNGQPESVKKTVEFVSERLASACVKHICTFVVPPHKQQAHKEIKQFLDAQQKELPALSPVRERNQKTALRMKVSHLAQEKLSSLRTKCGTELSDILSDRIPKSIDSLLAIDTLPQTRITCISITSRICRDRIKQWINSHVTVNLFMKDIEKELQKVFVDENKKQVEEKLVFAMPFSCVKENHNDKCLSGFHTVEKIKVMAVDILDKNKNIGIEDILNILNGISRSLSERCDLNDIITSYILSSLLDLVLLLLAHRPDLMPREDLLKKLTKIWQSRSSSTDDLFKDLLCPRNVTLLNESSSQKPIWSNFAVFVAFLVKENVVSCDNFEFQCTAFFRKDWEQNIIDNVCYFMKRFVEFYKQNGGDYSKFTMLMEFLSEFCVDL